MINQKPKKMKTLIIFITYSDRVDIISIDSKTVDVRSIYKSIPIYPKF